MEVLRRPGLCAPSHDEPVRGSARVARAVVSRSKTVRVFRCGQGEDRGMDIGQKQLRQERKIADYFRQRRCFFFFFFFDSDRMKVGVLSW